MGSPVLLSNDDPVLQSDDENSELPVEVLVELSCSC